MFYPLMIVGIILAVVGIATIVYNSVIPSGEEQPEGQTEKQTEAPQEVQETPETNDSRTDPGHPHL